MDLDQTQALDEPWTTDNSGPKRQVAWLTIVSGADPAGRKHPVYEGTAVIGRDPSCDICIDSKKLSKTHAAIEVEDGTHFLHDMSSRNGTRFGEFLLRPKVRYEVTPARREFILGNVLCRYDIIPTAADGAGSATDTDSDGEPPFVLDTERPDASGDEVLVENSYDEECSEPVSTVPTSLSKERRQPPVTSTPRSHQTQATLVLPESEQESSEEIVRTVHGRPRRILDSQADSESPDIGMARSRSSGRTPAVSADQQQQQTESFSVVAASEPDDATMQPTLLVDEISAADATGTTASTAPGLVAEPTQATQVFDTSTVDTDPTQPTLMMDASATAIAETTQGALFDNSATQPTQVFEDTDLTASPTAAGQGQVSNASSAAAAAAACDPTQPTLEYDSDASELMLAGDDRLDTDEDDAGEEAMDVTEGTVILDEITSTDGCVVSVLKVGSTKGAVPEVEQERDQLADDAATLAYLPGEGHDEDADTTGPEDNGDDDAVPNTGDDDAEEPTLAYGALATAEPNSDDDNNRSAANDTADDESNASPLYCNPEEDGEEPTQAYLSGAPEEDAESFSVPMPEPIADDDDDDEQPTLAYGLKSADGDGEEEEPTQAYGLNAAGDDKGGCNDDNDDDPTLGYALVGEGDNGEEPTQAYGMAAGNADAGDDGEEPTQAYGLAAGNADAGDDGEEPTQAYGMAAARADEDFATQPYGIDAAGAGSDDEGEEPTVACPIFGGNDGDEDVESQEYVPAAKVPHAVLARSPVQPSPTAATATGTSPRRTPPRRTRAGGDGVSPADIVEGTQASSPSPLKSCLPGLQKATANVQRGTKRQKRVLFAGDVDSDADDEVGIMEPGAGGDADGSNAAADDDDPPRKRRYNARSATAATAAEKRADTMPAASASASTRRSGRQVAGNSGTAAQNVAQEDTAHGDDNKAEKATSEASRSSRRSKKGVDEAPKTDVPVAEETVTSQQQQQQQQSDAANSRSKTATSRASTRKKKTLDVAAPDEQEQKQPCTDVSDLSTTGSMEDGNKREETGAASGPSRASGRRKKLGSGSEQVVTSALTTAPTDIDAESSEAATTEPVRSARASNRRKTDSKGNTTSTVKVVEETAAEEDTNDDASASSSRSSGRQKEARTTSSKKELSGTPPMGPEETKPAGDNGTMETLTPRGRGRKSKAAAAPAASADEDVKSSQDSKTEDAVAQSSGGRRGRRSLLASASSEGDASGKAENEEETGAAVMPRVMLTGIINEELRLVVSRLGGKMEDDNVRNCTHLVTDRIARTIKFLSCVARGTPIVTTDWLHASKKAKQFLDHSRYAVRDAEKEATFKFSLDKSLKRASQQPLFQGQRLYLCPSVKPPPDQMAEIVRCGGGEVLSSFPNKSSSDCIVVAAGNDHTSIGKCQQAGRPVVSPEYILTGVLRQSTSVEEYQLAQAEKEPPPSTATAAAPKAGGGGKRRSSLPTEQEAPAAKRGRRRR